MPVFQKITSKTSSHTNAEILKEFLVQQNKNDVRKTHLFEGRYENIYLNERHIPELKTLIDEALTHAKKILSASAPRQLLLRCSNKLHPCNDALSNYHPPMDINVENLRAGYWFNYMPPGATTTLHTHDDDDELLSAVYYVYVPENSGNLILYDASKSGHGEKIEIPSRTGDFIFFKPDIRHEVSKNNSTEHRLSIGINFGQREA